MFRKVLKEDPRAGCNEREERCRKYQAAAFSIKIKSVSEKNGIRWTSRMSELQNISPGDLDELTCWVELLPIRKLKHYFCFSIVYVKFICQAKRDLLMFLLFR